MVIYKIKSEKVKGYQQEVMAHDCISHWRRLNESKLSYYQDVMNMKTRRWNYELQCSVALTYHINLNKW